MVLKLQAVMSMATTGNVSQGSGCRGQAAEEDLRLGTSPECLWQADPTPGTTGLGAGHFSISEDLGHMGLGI